ncbi:exocyst complex component EXO70B1-like [Typha latifolia]|uniref:exocyst complex component EXO70B1-like n=1 Tax=Typha latifolia TaxID=4733 RepID=UPI003C2B0089
MAAAASVDGQDKVIAAAQHIVKSLATSKNAADDMIRILSGFDNRLSSITDLFPSSSASANGEFSNSEQIVLQWDASDSLLWESPQSDAASEYLAAVDELIASAADSSSSRADNVLQLAMSRLEEEFHHLMLRNAVPLDANDLYCSIRRFSLSFASDSGETIEDFDNSAEFDQQPPQQDGSLEERGGSSILDDRRFDLVRPESVTDLKEIADRMIWAGYGRELGQVFCSVRRDILDECLAILGIERISIDEVQRIEWRLLDDKMKKWIQGVKTVVMALLSGERQLCDQILVASDELKEECFVETAKGCVLQLLNFGDAITICQRSPEKLFRMLDMYEALTEVIPDLQALFVGESGEFICSEANGILKRLGDAVRGTLLEFGNAVQRETSRKPMQAGEIHPVTRYVMNYAKLLVVYSETLDMLLDDGDHVTTEVGDNDDARHFESTTPLGWRLVTLISYLEANLEEKSKLYEDSAMQYIFLMNNIFYIIQKVKNSELGRILGDNWIRRRGGKIRQYETSYLRASWTRVLSHLKDDGVGSGSSHSFSRMALKEKFKSFNLAFEEIYRTQTTWKVMDPQLREELKISISEKVIPAYRAFLGRFGGQLEGGRNAGKYIKYTPEDLESHLSDLFEGLPGLANHPRKKT